MAAEAPAGLARAELEGGRRCRGSRRLRSALLLGARSSTRRAEPVATLRTRRVRRPCRLGRAAACGRSPGRGRCSRQRLRSRRLLRNRGRADRRGRERSRAPARACFVAPEPAADGRPKAAARPGGRRRVALAETACAALSTCDSCSPISSSSSRRSTPAFGLASSLADLHRFRVATRRARALIPASGPPLGDRLDELGEGAALAGGAFSGGATDVLLGSTCAGLGPKSLTRICRRRGAITAKLAAQREAARDAVCLWEARQLSAPQGCSSAVVWRQASLSSGGFPRMGVRLADIARAEARRLLPRVRTARP